MLRVAVMNVLPRLNAQIVMVASFIFGCVAMSYVAINSNAESRGEHYSPYIGAAPLMIWHGLVMKHQKERNSQSKIALTLAPSGLPHHLVVKFRPLSGRGRR